jgi:hypothetical protein
MLKEKGGIPSKGDFSIFMGEKVLSNVLRVKTPGYPMNGARKYEKRTTVQFNQIESCLSHGGAIKLNG